jgi:HEAT repeat protein
MKNSLLKMREFVTYLLSVIILFYICTEIFYAGENDDPILEDKPVSQWIKQLRSENRGLQLRAATALAKAPAEIQPKIVPLLIPVLQSERENDKFVAAQVLGNFGPVARSAVPHLLPLLEGTQYERNRAAAAKALGQILKDAEPSDEVEKVTQALIAVFPDKYSDVRREAVIACGMIGPAAKSCIPHLPRMFDDAKYHSKPQGGPSWSEMYMVHAAAAWTAGRMGALAACHIDRLIAMLQGDRDISTTVVWPIGEIGPVHENVIPNLINRLEKALYGQYGGFAVGALSFTIGDIKEGTTEEYREFCFNVLAKFGPKSKPAIPLMIRCISDHNWHAPHRIRDAIGACKVLRAVGKEAKEAIPALENAAQFTKFDNRIPKETVERFKKEVESALTAIKE